MSHKEKAQQLLQWNSEHLTHDVELDQNDLSLFFAENFHVQANGKHYDANHDNYCDFLNDIRAGMTSINYDVHAYIESNDYVTIPLTAHINTISGEQNTYEAMLLLQFNQENDIVLWHEIYVEINPTG